MAKSYRPWRAGDSTMQNHELRRRWRLILGHYGECGSTHDGGDGDGGGDGPASPELTDTDRQRDQTLDYLYSREYSGRQELDGRQGGREASRLTAPRWLSQVRELFPRATAETLQRQALERYGLDELLTDPEVLERATPSLDLVRTLISCRSLLPAAAMGAARRIIRRVVHDLEEKLAQQVCNAILGSRRRGVHGGRPNLANLDWQTTLRRNLKNYDSDYDTLVLQRLYFLQRQQRKLRWDIIVLVDQSGSMLDSVIHSAVLAAIFTGLQTLRTRLVLFDTQVVDISDRVGDPVEVLLGVQLGGGTDIARALDYAAGRVENPRRTLVVLITDFYEGGNPKRLVATARALHESGVRLLGLAALDERAEPDYDHQMAQKLANHGMEIGAMTPDQLADWVGRAIQ